MLFTGKIFRLSITHNEFGVLKDRFTFCDPFKMFILPLTVFLIFGLLGLLVITKGKIYILYILWNYMLGHYSYNMYSQACL